MMMEYHKFVVTIICFDLRLCKILPNCITCYDTNIIVLSDFTAI